MASVPSTPTNIECRGRETYKLLSCTANGPTVDSWSHDDASGRQQWVFEPVSAWQFRVRTCDPARADWYLSRSGSGKVALRRGATGSTVWELSGANGGGWSMSATDATDGLRYLSAHSDGWDRGVDLYSKVTSTLRQTWVVTPAGAPVPAPAPTPTPTPTPTPDPAPVPAGTLLTIDPALQFPGWGAASKRTRLSYDDGGVRITFPPRPHASAGGTNWGFSPPGMFPAKEARASFNVYVQRDFPFEASGSSAGKFGIGIEGGPGAASGGNWSKNGVSFRPMWLGAGPSGSGAMGYVYTEVSNPNDHRASADQQPGVLDTVVMTNGGHNFWRKNTEQLELRKGQWNECSVYMKLNTPGKYDGVIEMTTNGETKRIDNFRWLLPGSKTKIEKFWVASWFGGSGSDPSWSPGRQCHQTIKDVRVWTKK
jgi:hypothetical protein